MLNALTIAFQSLGTRILILFPSKPTQDVLTEYTKKVNFLVGLLEAEKLVCLN